MNAGFLEEALKEAAKARDLGEVPVGAVVVRGSEILARAHNLRERDRDPTAHAEILALRCAANEIGAWRLSGCTLYVTLEPCPMCLAAAGLARVDRVVYGASDPKGGAVSLGFGLHADQRLNHRFEVVHEAVASCGQILTDFFRGRRATER